MAITAFAQTSNPADAGAALAAPGSITPPASMVDGDLVYVQVTTRNNVSTITNSTTGGQTWNALTNQNGGVVTTRAFWARYNGSWAANPAFTTSGSTTVLIQMFVFRPTSSSNNWAVDGSMSSSTFSATATITITGRTTGQDSTVTIASWASQDDNTWGSLSGSGWSVLGGAQYRNDSNFSATFAYNIQTTTAALTDVSKTELTLGIDSGVRQLVTFYESSSSPSPSVSDSATGAESVTLLIDRLVPSVSDNSTGAETVAARPQVSPSVSDSATGTESISASGVSSISVSDSAAGSESTSLDVGLGRSVSDLSSASESVSLLIPILYKSVSDDATGSELATLSVNVPVNIVDLISGSDQPSLDVRVAITAADDSTATDTATLAIPIELSVADNTQGSESLSISIQSQGEISASVQDNSTGSDSVSLETSPVQLQVVDLTSALDSPTVGVNVIASAADDATATDSTSQALIVSISVSDSGVSVDSISATVSAALSVYDSATASDSVSVVVNSAGITGTAYVVQDDQTGAATGTIHLVITGVQYAVQNDQSGFQVGYVGAPPPPFTITRTILGVGK